MRRAREQSLRRINWLRVVLVVTAIVAASVAVGARFWPRSRPPATQSMRTAAGGLEAKQATEAPAAPANPRTYRDRLMVAAYSMRGVPYEWGAKGPDKLDCSGFTKAAYSAIGVRLPDGSFNQAEGEKPLHSLDELSPGDLLFYRWGGSDAVTHVTLYAGEGWAIGTGSPGQPKEVVVYPLSGDMRIAGTVITYRHIALADER